MKHVTYSAPGKVILSGEHAVVYGKPALVSAIDLRLKFTILERSLQDSKLDKEMLFISQKVKDFLINNNISFVDKAFSYIIESEIPVGRGLGSSAALSVASSAAFLEFYTGKIFDKEIVNNLAFEIEKHFHKNPSGVDNYASCFGGLILYQKKIKLKNLDYKIPKNIEEKLFLIDSGKPEETTGEMVESVKSVKSVETFLNRIEIETKKILDAIENIEIDLFKESIINNEKLLEKLEVVSEKTKKLLLSLSNFGVGKVTGAGGKKTNSGFILFLADDKEKLIKYLKQSKIPYLKFVPDNQGFKKIHFN